MNAEIKSGENFLDEATKWVYADEKGVQVFALYGIGDGTDATPLYAVGGKQAAVANVLILSKMEDKKMALTATEQTLASWLAAFGATKSMSAAILMLLNEKEQLQEELINYMVEHQKETPRELLEETLRISGE